MSEASYGRHRKYMKFMHKNEAGQLHCTDGPALKTVQGDVSWYINGKLHRDGGPALIQATGGVTWYEHGKIHREDGPASVEVDGSWTWYKHNRVHRVDGPAVWVARSKQSLWYIEGECLTDEQVQTCEKILTADLKDLPLYMGNPLYKGVLRKRFLNEKEKGNRAGA